MTETFDDVVKRNTVYWYRYYDRRVAEYYGDDLFGPSLKTEVLLQKIPVVRFTPKGVWLDYIFPKFVLKDANKRWACPTIDEAMVSFMARKVRQRGILSTQLKHVKDAIKIAEEMNNGRDADQTTDIR